jgi:hypothetical protein
VEDLFVNEERRNDGAGVLVMHVFGKDLPITTVQCLSLARTFDWNAGGLAFCKKIGAKIHEVQTSRCAGRGFRRFRQSKLTIHTQKKNHQCSFSFIVLFAF